MLPLALAALLQGPLELREALYLANPTRPGRLPVPQDVLLDRVARDTFTPPTDGETIGERTWKSVKADGEGWLTGVGYYCMTVESPVAETRILEALGDSYVYVNGVLRGGDPYGFGYVRVPISLKAGRNVLLFMAGRDRLKARLLPVRDAVSLDLGDPTFPDVLPTDRGALLGGIVVQNALPQIKSTLKIRASLADGRMRESALPPIPALSFRKVPFALPLPFTVEGTNLPIKLELMEAGRTISEAKIELRIRDLKQTYRRTFLSNVDGSVQYYAVNPAQTPSSKNVLALSLHGASVEAQGQAEAYAPKEDVSIVAATNRRPYGFDWEEIGRIDALEVLEVAKRNLPHDPQRVVLTGHSMGGHGTWSVGSLFPDKFAALAPSAGWVSFWSYGGGWNPEPGRPADAIVRRAMEPMNTLGRITNTLAQGVYILHGDADTNVRVDQARTMKKALEALPHPDLGYHEEPGAEHWWSGAVDYPDLFAMLRKRTLDPNPAEIDFTTPSPAVSSRAWWATVDAVSEPGLPARIRLKRSDAVVEGTTENVARLILQRPVRTVKLDGQSILVTAGREPVVLIRRGNDWRETTDPIKGKTATAMGPFKSVFNRRVAFIVPTGGTVQENQLALDHARFDAETLQVRGNGGVDIVTDSQVLKGGFERRNLLLYGNADTNRAWSKLLKDSPVTVKRGRVQVGARTLTGSDLGLLLVRPKPGIPECLVGAMASAGPEGARRLMRMATFTSGVAYPDWTLIGSKGLLGAGFFGNDWALGTGVTGWNP